jgi:hypothetical protein
VSVTVVMPLWLLPSLARYVKLSVPKKLGFGVGERAVFRQGDRSVGRLRGAGLQRSLWIGVVLQDAVGRRNLQRLVLGRREQISEFVGGSLIGRS